MLPSRFAARHGAELLAALATRDDPTLQAVVPRARGQQGPDKTLLKALQESVRQRAAQLGIEPEILATRRELAALALGAAPPHLQAGWRAAQLGDIAPAAAR